MTSISVFILFISFLVVGLLAPIATHGFVQSRAARRFRRGQFDQGPSAPDRLSASSLKFPSAAPAPCSGLLDGELAVLHSASHRETATDLSRSGR